MQPLTITPLTAISWVQPGDDVAQLLIRACDDAGVIPVSGDVLVLAQKIVSKAENRFRSLDDVRPSPRAQELARDTRKDPRLVELVLEESVGIVRAAPGVLIVRHRSGLVMANAGIDASNLSAGGNDDQVLLLPEDADAAATQLRSKLMQHWHVELGVVIADSFGRPWRNGVTNVAIGAAGLPALLDRRSERDLSGREMQVTQVAVGDLVASAAGLVMGEGDEGIPAAFVHGLPDSYSGLAGDHGSAADLVRPLQEDLFR